MNCFDMNILRFHLPSSSNNFLEWQGRCILCLIVIDLFIQPIFYMFSVDIFVFVVLLSVYRRILKLTECDWMMYSVWTATSWRCNGTMVALLLHEAQNYTDDHSKKEYESYNCSCYSTRTEILRKKNDIQSTLSMPIWLHRIILMPFPLIDKAFVSSHTFIIDYQRQNHIDILL